MTGPPYAPSGPESVGPGAPAPLEADRAPAGTPTTAEQVGPPGDAGPATASPLAAPGAGERIGTDGITGHDPSGIGWIKGLTSKLRDGLPETRALTSDSAEASSRRPEVSVRAAGERGLEIVGRQGWLDRPGYRIEHVLSLALAAWGGAGERAGNLLHGTWLGHPLHPLLASLPTGAVASTMTLDVVDVFGSHARGAGLRGASRLSLGVGIVGSLAAAVTGVNDWQHTQEDARRVGLVHGALNAAATGLYVLSWLDRGRDRHARGVAATALAYGITAVSGYLGASLVYRFGTGVDQSGGRLVLAQWTPVLAESELEAGKPRRLQVAGMDVVLLRDGEQVLAVGEHCPHLAAPMQDGWVDRGRIVCPWHGSQFEPGTGTVLRGPATAPLPCYPARVRAGMVEVGASRPAPMTGKTRVGE